MENKLEPQIFAAYCIAFKTYCEAFNQQYIDHEWASEKVKELHKMLFEPSSVEVIK